MKLKDLVKICDPKLILCIRVKSCKGKDGYIFDGHADEVPAKLLDSIVVRVASGVYDNCIEIVIA